MFTAKESSQMCQQFSAWNLPDLDHMSCFQPEQKHSLLCFPPATSATNLAFPGKYTYDLLGLDTVQHDADAGSLKLLPQHGNIPCPSRYPYVKDTQFALPPSLGVMDRPIGPSAAPQKRFLIFDKSGNQTRLFYSPYSPENQAVAPTVLTTAYDYSKKMATRDDQRILVKPTAHKSWDEHDLAEGEGEMLEDSEEIDALLYSDSDDEYNDDDVDGDDDEVTSTGHTPYTFQEDYVKSKLLEEEVASSDDSPKRQRLLDGRYKKSLLVSFDSPMKQAGYEDDIESSCAGSRNYYDDIDLRKREKKVKIRDTLRTLQNIIPGLKSNDPFSIIDKAIAYLKTMKTEAEALGLSYSEPESTTFSQ